MICGENLWSTTSSLLEARQIVSLVYFISTINATLDHFIVTDAHPHPYALYDEPKYIDLNSDDTTLSDPSDVHDESQDND